MARTRSLKPSFFTDDELANLSPLHRLLFQGLWCHADREGKLEDRPRRIKVEVLPFDDCDVDAMLDELAANDFVERYEVDGKRIVRIPSFLKHQSPHHKEPASVLPSNAGAERVPGLTPTEPGQVPDESGKHLNKNQGPRTKDQGPDRARDAGEVFDTIWRRHPNDQKLDQAQAAFYRLVEPDDFETVDAQHVLHCERWKHDDPAFVPSLQSWLTAWRDRPRPLPQTAVDKSDARAAELLAEAGVLP